jgi:hypothetical protein
LELRKYYKISQATSHCTENEKEFQVDLVLLVEENLIVLALMEKQMCVDSFFFYPYYKLTVTISQVHF